MEVLKTWYNQSEWQVDFSPNGDACIITRAKDFVSIAGESYPLNLSNGRMISVIRQVGDRVFICVSESSAKSGSYYATSGTFHHRLELINCKVRYLESYRLDDRYRSLYTKEGVDAYKKLLGANCLIESQPKFEKCLLNGHREYDQSKYEIIATSEYLIVKNLKTGQICAGETKMECLGFRQKNEVILGIFRDKNKELYLRRFEISPRESALIPTIGKGLTSHKKWERGELELVDLDCQIDDERIYTPYGQYLISKDMLLKPPCSTVQPVVMRREGDPRCLSLVLVAECVSDQPKVLALMDPYTEKMEKKVLNLMTGEICEIECYSDLYRIAENTSKSVV